MGIQAKFDELMSKNEFLNNLNLKINKIMPSLLFFSLILLLIIALVLIIVWPRYSEVNITFKANNIQLVEDFEYVVSVNGKEFTGMASAGTSKLNLPKGDLTFKTISISAYDYKIKDYEFSDNLVVVLQDKVKDVGVSLYLFNNDGTLFNKSANLSFSCNSSDLELEDKVVDNGYLEMVIPSNCGRLNISAQSDGYDITKGQTCDSYSCSLELSPITQNFSGVNNLPSGALKVKVLDELGNTISGANVKIFDILDSQYDIDSSLTNLAGLTKTFNSLTVGKYNVYVAYSGYMSKTVTVDVTENNVLEQTVSISKSALGMVNLNIIDESSKKLSGSLIVKDSLGQVIYREDTTSGTIQMPIYSYDKFYLDFAPNDEEYFPVTNYVLELNATIKSATILVKEVSTYESAKIKIRVVDEDSNPVENARVFLVDELTQFDLLSYNIRNTDSNGKTNFILQEGMYKLRAYNGFSEAYSNTFSVTKRDSGDIPEIDVEIQMVFGYSTFDLEILDQYNTNKIGAEVNFYKKPNTFEGAKLTDSQGKVFSPFKAGTKMYYTVNLDDYMPFYSESRLLLTNYTWQDKISLEPEKQGSPRVKYLGVFEEIGKDDVKTMSIGNTYYLGFEFAVYDVDKTIELDFTIGNNDTIEKEKFYVIDVFSSANSDIKYSSIDKNITLGDAKIVNSKWLKAKKGIYRIYYKVKVKDNSSVKLYDPLKVNWNLKVDDSSVVDETKEFLVGSKVLCYPNSFCGRYNLLDVSSDLYVDFFDNTFTINAGKVYSLNFDLINGIAGVTGEINSGYLQIYNALSVEEGFATVKNAVAERSFLELLRYNLQYNNDNKEIVKNLYGIFEEYYPLKSFFQNRYVTGNLDFRPISQKKSYLNFLIVDDDRKVVVTGNPAMSILIDSISQKEFKVSFFPDKVLAPESNQQVKVLVKDDSNSFVSNAIVSFRLKNPKDTIYNIYPNCRNLLTDQYGEVNCDLDAEDLLPGTYIQILVQKDGFSGYGRTDFKPDLTVSNKIFEFDTEKLETSLSYPAISEMFRDLGIINNTAKTIMLDSSEIKFSNYSQDVYDFLNYEEMQAYIKESHSGKEILGRELFNEFDYPDLEAKTVLKNYFKSALRTEIASELDSDVYVNGFVTLSFKTDKDNFERVIPFTVNLIADGYPSNSDCLYLALNSENSSFASDGKEVKIPLEFENRCNIELQNNYDVSQLPVEFDNLYVVLNYKKGALSLGNYVFNLNSYGSQALSFAVPKVITSNFSHQELLSPELIFTPAGSYGKQELSFKIFGTVKTSQGIKKVESNELDFELSVININDCIKVLYEDKEIDQLILTPDDFEDLDYTAVNVTNSANEFNLTFKNICNVPLDVQICKDSKGNIPLGCGEEYNLSNEEGNIYYGFTFEGLGENRSYLIEKLSDSKEVNIYRPSISGAYALEVFVKQTYDDGFKRTKFIPVNVQTTIDNDLFSDMPFLEVLDDNTSDVLRIYNTDVPGDNRLTNKSVFLNILNDSIEGDITKPSPIRIVDESEFLKFSNDSGYTGSHKANTAVAFGTIIGTTAVVIGILAAAGVISTTGIGWIVGAALALAAAIMALASISYMDDWQESQYLLIEDLREQIQSFNFDESIYYGTNYDLLFAFTGQNQYSYKIVKEFMKGQSGMTGESWSRSFSVDCGGDYFVDEYFTLDSTDASQVKKNNVEFENCTWEKDPEISQDKKSVTFFPKCSGGGLDTVYLETYVVVGCKLNPDLWSRVSLGGIKNGYPNVGQTNLQFKSVNYNNFPNGVCNEEWCFKIYPITIDNGILGDDYKSSFRVAFKNSKPESIEYGNPGLPCTDASGNVIGFTGENAKPKVDYTWDDLNENFCSELDDNNNLQRYCDSTQFLISALERLNNANSKINSLEQPDCPYRDAYSKLKDELFVDNDNYKMEYVILEDTNDIYLTITLKEYLSSADDPMYSMKAQFKGKSIDFNVDSGVVPYNNIYKRNTVFVTKQKIYSIPDTKTLKDGDNSLLDEDIEFFVSSNNVLKESFTGHIKLTGFKWPGGCLISNPSTNTLPDGRMVLFNFYEDDQKDELFEIQDLLHYRAYLMNDGFSDDFLNDFVETILYTDFLNDYSPLLQSLDLETKIKENRFRILNTLNQKETMGPGEYGIHINVIYDVGSTNIKDANIELRIEKIKHAENDNIFYYIPLDARLGLVGESNLNRVGYGTELSGDNVRFDNPILNQTLIGAYTSDSSPKASLNVSRDLSFEELNGKERGTILNVKRLGKDFDFKFAENLNYKEFITNIKNSYEAVDVGFNYTINYAGNNYSIALPWNIIPNGIDLTGKDQNYTLYSQRFENNEYGFLFPAINVINVSETQFNTKIYGNKNFLNNSDIIFTKKTNVEIIDQSSNIKTLNINTVQNIFEGIAGNKLCISSNSNNNTLRVFVNENYE